MSNNNNGNNSIAPLVSLLSAKFLLIFVLIIYFSFSILNGLKFLPSEWSPIAIFYYIFVNLLVMLLYIGVLTNYNVINADAWLGTVTNLDAYKKMTKFDAVLAHYTNVASVGLFLGVLIYSGKQYSAEYPRMVVAGVTILMSIIFALYSVMFARLASRFAKEKKLPILTYIFLSFTIFFVDSAAISMFIDAVPDVKNSSTVNK